MKIAPTIIIDSREQTPWRFENLPSARGALSTGDYSILGLESLIALERKSLDDLLGCVGRERDRFRAELQRMKAYPYRALVIEASAADLDRGEWRSKLQPAHVLGALSAWTMQFALPIWLGGDHATSGRFAEKLLFQAARAIANQYEAAAAFLSGAPSPVAAEAVPA